jgi:hypothetical protein
MENPDTHANIGTGIDPTGDRSGASPVDERLQKALDKTLYAGGRPAAQKVRNFLNGTWLGEPLHVVLKDVPTGAWTVAMVFDVLDLVLDRKEFAVAADTSVAIGIAGAAGATLAGVTDWSDVDPPTRRLGSLRFMLVMTNRGLSLWSLSTARTTSALMMTRRRPGHFPAL